MKTGHVAALLRGLYLTAEVLTLISKPIYFSTNRLTFVSVPAGERCCHRTSRTITDSARLPHSFNGKV